jgi:hypothetical protein
MKKQSHEPLSSLGLDTVRPIEVGAAKLSPLFKTRGMRDGRSRPCATDGLAIIGEIHRVNAEDVSCDADSDRVV